MHNLLEILILTLRNFTKLPVLRYLGICNVLHTYYGTSGSSLLTESIDSIIIVCTLKSISMNPLLLPMIPDFDYWFLGAQGQGLSRDKCVPPTTHTHMHTRKCCKCSHGSVIIITIDTEVQAKTNYINFFYRSLMILYSKPHRS